MGVDLMKKLVCIIGVLGFFIFSFIYAEESEYEDFISVELQDGTFELRLIEDYLYEYDLQLPLSYEYKLSVAIKNALATTEVVSAEKVIPIKFNGNPDFILSSQAWRFEYTNMDKIWDDLDNIPYLEGQLNPIIVAVIDTGIKVDHEDINIILDAGIDVADEDDDPTDYNSHGTHVAGIIGAKKEDSGDKVVGMAPGVKILPIKMYKDNGDSSTFLLAKSIQYAIDHNADVITMSLSYAERSGQVTDVLRKAEAAGIVVIASTDNMSNHWVDGEVYHERYNGENRRSVIMNYPAAEDTVLAVGSVRQNPSIREIGISDFSDIGGVVLDVERKVDVVAPGSFISSSSFISNTDPITKSGTSMATPHVAGYVALLMAKYPQLTPAQIREVVRSTAYDPGIVIPEGYDREATIGNGLIDVQAGLNFSPLINLSFGGLNTFTYEPMVYEKTYNVTNDISSVNISSTIMQDAILNINGEQLSTKSIPLNIGENIVVIKATLNNVIRTYTYTIYRDTFTDPLVSNLIVTGTLVSPIAKIRDGEFQVVVEDSVNSVKITFELKDPNALLSINCSDYIYSNNSEVQIDLDSETSIVIFKVKLEDGTISQYALSIPHKKDVIRTETDLPLHSNVVETIEIEYPKDVGLRLNTDIVALHYGALADEQNKSYSFLASVTGTDVKEVIWSVDDERYVTVDEFGRVTTKNDVPIGTGDIIVNVKATTVVGGVSASAMVIFVERTPLGNENFSAPYISGYSDGTFKPKKNLSRAEVAVIFSKILNLDLSSPGTQIFEDVNVDYWGYPYIQSMFQTKIFMGYTDDGNRFFNPDAPISRAEIAQVFTNYWSYRKIEVDGSSNHNIPDVPSTHWAAIPINRLYNTEIFSGYLNGAYRPNDDTLREQMVNMINKLIGRPVLPSEMPKFSDVPIDYSFYGDIEAASSFYYKKIDE